jgi:hypothetical protein
MIFSKETAKDYPNNKNNNLAPLTKKLDAQNNTEPKD